MAIKDIHNYISANQDKYSSEVLLEQLRKAGYPEKEIQETLAIRKSFGLSSGMSAQPIAFQTIGSAAGSFLGGFLSALGLIIGANILIGGFTAGMLYYFRYYYLVNYLRLSYLMIPLIPLFLFFRYRRSSPRFAWGALAFLITAVFLSLVAALFFILVFRNRYFNF